MKNRKRKVIKDAKVRGEWVESVFLARAGEEGLTVSKPWGESRRFDFVVGRPPHFVSAGQMHNGVQPFRLPIGCAAQ